MKKYVNPELEIIKSSVEDIITTSGIEAGIETDITDTENGFWEDI